MSHYRIKIEERYNGEKRYIPQVSRLVNTGGWIKRQRIVWDNILTYDHGHRTDSIIKYSYLTEQEALDIIESYKKQIDKKNGEEVKSVTYKII
jgi:hypothetical protein